MFPSSEDDERLVKKELVTEKGYAQMRVAVDQATAQRAGCQLWVRLSSKATRPTGRTPEDRATEDQKKQARETPSFMSR